MCENEDFVVDKNGIILDCPPGTLLLDENGIVQDTDYSALQFPGDYEDTQLSLYDSQPYQSFIRSSQLDEQSWYCISDLEISDDEKDGQSTLENVTTKSTYSGRQHAYKGQVDISEVIPGNQMLDYDYNQVISSNFPNQAACSPLNYETSHELSHYIYDKDPLEVFMNQPNSSFQQNNNDSVTNYQTPAPTGAANTMYFYQKRDLFAVSESSSKSNLSIPEGLTASERELYLQHANVSQILDSSHNESYQLEEGHQVQEDDVDDELFLITGHIDFDAHQPSRPGSANVWGHSSRLGQEMAKGSEGNCPKSRVERRSVSFDLLPQEQSFNPNEEIPSFAHDSRKIFLPGNIQENNVLFKQKKSRDQCCGTSQCHPAFDQNISEQHSEQFQEINKGPNSFFNPDISLNSDSNLVNGNSLVRNEQLNSSYLQYLSDESFQVLENQKMPIFPENPSRQSALAGKRNFEKHQNGSQTTMNKLENSGHAEMEEESLSKSKTNDSVKSFRAKSKSTTNIYSPLTPVKSKYKSLSELSNIPIYGDDGNGASNLKLSFSIKDLNARLEEEFSKRKKATELVEQLQNRYDNLLTKYADAEMMIDELRIGSKMAPKMSDFKSSQSPITNLIMNRALVTSTPMASTFSMNQSLREDDDRLPLSGNLILNNAERNAKTKQNDQQPSKSEKIKADLILQANHLESKINTLVSLLEKRQLTAKELKKVFDNIRSEQDKQRREYLRVKEEFQIIGTNNEEVFDKDKELEGYLFQLQMRFDELEDKHKHLQENQKEPFQETENQVNETSTSLKMVADSQVKDEAEEKRQKFLSQYNSLMDRYHRLKISGSLNENDEEVKEIKKKLQVISEELCLNEQQQRLTMRNSDADSKIRDSPKVKNQVSAQFSGQNVSLLEGIHKTSTTIGSPTHQKATSSHPKKSDKKGSRIVRSLPAPPKDSGESSQKKSDEVSSTTSVPDSGIFEELNGTSHRHPSVTNKMRLASLRGQRIQSLVPVHTESSDGPATIDNSSRVSVTPNRRRNSLGLAEVSLQSTEAASLNSQVHGDDSLLWQPAVTTLHNFLSDHGRSTESEPIEYSSENSDQTDLDTSERPVLRKDRPKSILRRKYKPSKIRPSSNEDGSQIFLVDFQKKAIDKQQQNKEEEEEKKEENDYSEDEFVDSPSNPDEKWVEYTDNLGRTRTCMKKDLETMQKRDKEMGILPASLLKSCSESIKEIEKANSHCYLEELPNYQKKEEKTMESSVGSNIKGSGMLSSQEIYCQLLKEKWKTEEEEAQAKPVGPVHYENVRFDEIRTHGVGYFQFSKDETERQEQMDLLSSIRDQTKDERNKRNQLKEKRDSLMTARLKKIKDRQRAKMGLPPEPEMEEESSPDPKIIENISREVKPEDVAKNPAPVREWDLGKDKFWESEKKYFKERREERDSEFAPPSSYFSSNAASTPKRKYLEQEYSPPPERKPVPQKLKKDKIKQQQQQEKNGTVKEKKMRNCQVVPDLATIPLPGEAIPSKNTDQNEKLTSNNNYAAEYQQPQPDGSSKTTAASSDNIVPSQIWGQPAAMTTPQYNDAGAFSNQQQSIYPGNVATTTVYQYTQASSSDSVVTQQTVVPEKPKPTIVDRRFVKNVESLQHL